MESSIPQITYSPQIEVYLLHCHTLHTNDYYYDMMSHYAL